jgi:hypothetical protein
MRIVIVGVCASGKTSLASKCQQLGYDAGTVAQEHSEVPTLWRHNSPDVLIYLDASMAAIRKRRDIDWGEDFLVVEQHRLQNARQACDLYVKTNDLNEAQVFRRVRRFLEKKEGEIDKQGHNVV